MKGCARGFAGEVDHSHAGPGLSQIDFLRVDVDHGGTEGIAGRVGDQLFGQIHRVVVVAERLVRLHHRELRVVASRDSFVAEHTTNLVHPLHATDDQSLEVKFESDSEEEGHVERIVMRDEGACVGTTRLDMEYGGFDFDESVALQRAAKARDGGVANLEGAARLFVDDQVRVSLSVARVDVGESMPLVGHWSNALGKQRHARCLDRQFTLAGGHDESRSADPVTQIEFVDLVEPIVAHDGLGDEQLDFSGAVAQGDEDQLALVALEHHASCDGHLDVGFGTCFE